MPFFLTPDQVALLSLQDLRQAYGGLVYSFRFLWSIVMEEWPLSYGVVPDTLRKLQKRFRVVLLPRRQNKLAIAFSELEASRSKEVSLVLCFECVTHWF